MLVILLLGISTGFGQDFCQTWEVYEQEQIAKYGVLYNTCDNGPCDDPANRDAEIPGPTDPIITLRIFFNVFCNDDGSNCASDPTTIAQQVDALNAAYLPLRIQFQYDYIFINSSQFRNSSGTAEEALMKSTYAFNPDQQLNVYIVGRSGGSYGTFPWDDGRLPLSAQGGVVLYDGHVYPQPYHDNVLAHEVGHCLGLWHTHHGVTEVYNDCQNECYERADGVNGDITGDLCSDTPPTPTNTSCNEVSGNDLCSGVPWAPTDRTNFMGYGPIGGSTCWNHFTTQQWGRIHCWTNQVLAGWMVGNEPEVISSITPAPNSIDINQGQAIVVEFTEAMNPATINAGTFLVRSRQRGDLAGTVFYVPSPPSAYFVATGQFVQGDEVLVTLTSDVAVADGSPSFSGYNWRYIIGSCASADFSPASGYTTVPQPIDMLAGDFTGDGAIDIVAASTSASNTVALVPNTGGGSLGSPQALDLGTNTYGRGFTTADFDGDGDLDLAIPCWFSETLVIMTNDGQGNFTIAHEYSVPGIRAGSDVGDINSDGAIDVVATLGLSDQLAVFLNAGDGSFGSPSIWPALDYPAEPKAVDINNDGALDVVLVNVLSDIASAYINHGGSLDTRFDFSDGYEISNITAADFDGDGYVDVATISHTDSRASIYLNSGNETFALAQTVTGVSSPTIAAADFDSDGDIDLVSGTYDDDQVEWVENVNGLFTLHNICCFDKLGFDVAAVDIDGDGSVDIVSANRDDGVLAVVLNSGPPPAPQLYSPVDGKTLTAPATPTLTCLAVSGGQYYHFLIDDDPNFGSPQGSSIFNTQLSWAPYEALTVGTYYWKVQSANACGLGPWSDVWTIVVQSGGGGGTSCPVLFVGTDNGFVEENPLLTACEQSAYKSTVTDYYTIQAPVSDEDGFVHLQLRELEDEITFLEAVELIAVDHAAAVTVQCAVDGTIQAYTATAPPLTAVTGDGVDVLELLVAADGKRFETGEGGSIILTFPSLEQSSALVVEAQKKTPCPQDDGGGEKFARETGSGDIRVEQAWADGQWLLLAEPPTREYAVDQFVALDQAAVEKGAVITVRLTWEGAFSTDAVSQTINGETLNSIDRLSAASVSLTRQSWLDQEWPGFGGGEPLVLRKGDQVDLTFDVAPASKLETERTYIVKATGKYHPDYGVHTNLTPSDYMLYENYPNPFNPSTTISYNLAATSAVKLDVVNVLGQTIRTLVNETQVAGHHRIEWNGRTESGETAASGIYFYRLSTEQFSDTKKMLLVK
jgi:hypothetical protein